MTLQWWCFAQAVPWTWTWRAYPGVWLALMGAVLLHRRAARASASGGERWRHVCGGVGLGLLWATLDWPVGTLGAGYLASVHMIQYLLLALVVSPLLLLGLPVDALRDRWPRRRVVSLATRPDVALPVFVLTTIVTHVPYVVDGLMRTQLGSFVLDLSWIATGILLWWPLVAAEPEHPRFPPLLQLLYLFPVILVHSGIGAYLMLSEFPVYATYELAPPTGWLSPVADQQVAAGLMWVVAAPYMFAVIGVIFLRWSGAEELNEDGGSWMTPSIRNLTRPPAA